MRDIMQMIYYTDYESQSIFIAELNGQIAGYLAGCKNIKRYRKIFITRILPIIVVKGIFSGYILKKKNVLFLYNCILSFLKREFFTMDFSVAYPATLHINIDAKYRGLEYLCYLKKRRNKGGLPYHSIG